MTMPTIFVAHGAPPLLDEPRWIEELNTWAHALPKPEAVLMLSAHWEERPITLGATTTVPLVYVLGTRTVGRRAGVVGAGLFALSPMATFYATEARAYALMMLLVVLSTLALLRALDTNEARWWAAFAVAVIAAMYTHYTCIFVLATQAGWALFTRRDRLRPLLIAYSAAVAQRMEQIFMDDIALSRPVTYENWKRRGVVAKLLELLALPVRDQL